MVIVAIAAAILFIPIAAFTSNEDRTSLNLVLLAGFIFIEVLLFLFNNRLQDKRDLIQKREKHSSDLYDVYKRLMHIHLRKGYGQSLDFHVPVRYEDSFNYLHGDFSEVDLMLVNDIENFDWAMEHLKDKKYENIQNAWATANEYLERINKISMQFSSLFEPVTKDKMQRAFASFVNGDEVTENFNKDSYSVRNIARKLEGKYGWILDGGKIIKVEKELHQSGKYYRINLYGEVIMTSPNEVKLSAEYVEDTLRSIVDDPELSMKYKELVEAYRGFNNALDQFNENLGHLVKKLKGGYLIEGKCELGY